MIQLSEEIRKKVILFQQTEITEYHIYKRLAQRIKSQENAKILDQIAEKKLTFVEQPVTITYSAYSIAKGQRIMNAANIVKDQVMGKLVR